MLWRRHFLEQFHVHCYDLQEIDDGVVEYVLVDASRRHKPNAPHAGRDNRTSKCCGISRCSRTRDVIEIHRAIKMAKDDASFQLGFTGDLTSLFLDAGTVAMRTWTILWDHRRRSCNNTSVGMEQLFHQASLSRIASCRVHWISSDCRTRGGTSSMYPGDYERLVQGLDLRSLFQWPSVVPLH